MMVVVRMTTSCGWHNLWLPLLSSCLSFPRSRLVVVVVVSLAGSWDLPPLSKVIVPLPTWPTTPVTSALPWPLLSVHLLLTTPVTTCVNKLILLHSYSSNSNMECNSPSLLWSVLPCLQALLLEMESVGILHSCQSIHLHFDWQLLYSLSSADEGRFPGTGRCASQSFTGECVVCVRRVCVCLSSGQCMRILFAFLECSTGF